MFTPSLFRILLKSKLNFPFPRKAFSSYHGKHLTSALLWTKEHILFREERPDKMPMKAPKKSELQHLSHQMWSETEGPGSFEALGCYFGNRSLGTIDLERPASPEVPGLGCSVLAFSFPQPWMWAATPMKQVTQKYNRGVASECHTSTQPGSSHLVNRRCAQWWSQGLKHPYHDSLLPFRVKGDRVASHWGWESGAHFH